ncbi:MAG: proline dehydrogenase [Vulcanimicrobiaceae bacterium]
MNVLDRPLRAIILGAADNRTVRRFIARHGMRLGAGRFVAGETAETFMGVARRTNEAGFAVAAGILGEGTADPAGAAAAAAQYRGLLERFAAERTDANVALKATHLGLGVDAALALQNVRSVVECAKAHGNFVRLDMEQSHFVDAILTLYRSLQEGGLQNVGFVLQSYLHRSMKDLERHLGFASNVRIVKGAYLEPETIAYADKRDVDENFRRLVERSLADGRYTAIATHDASLIAKAAAFAERNNIPKRGRFEFQMLYGVATPLARQLLDRGYRVRLAVPFGDNWFPYFMRRLAERPANLAFFARNLLVRGAA